MARARARARAKESVLDTPCFFGFVLFCFVFVVFLFFGSKKDEEEVAQGKPFFARACAFGLTERSGAERFLMERVMSGPTQESFVFPFAFCFLLF